LERRARLLVAAKGMGNGAVAVTIATPEVADKTRHHLPRSAQSGLMAAALAI
jgi:hypothetical protein